MAGLVFLAVVVLACGAIPGGVSFLAVRWCLEQRLKSLCVLMIVALGAGTVYGLLRLTGLLVFPADHCSSFLFWGSTYREEGLRWLYGCGSLLVGGIAALCAGRGKEGENEGEE